MWTLDAGLDPPRWRCDAPHGAVLTFSTRRGGVSRPPYDSLNLGRSTGDDPDAVTENRRRLLAALGLGPDALATAGQVHGAAVATVGAPGHVHDHDALVTTVPGVALAVSTADCVPLLYTAPGAVGAAHAGWRGVADGMPAVALRAVARSAGTGAGAITVHLGPCIRACCYAVHEDVLARFEPDLAVHRAGRHHLDLVAAARRQLERAGVPAAAIHDTGACTACQPDWYFSHRRDAGPTGRLWAIAMLRRAP